MHKILPMPAILFGKFLEKYVFSHYESLRKGSLYTSQKNQSLLLRGAVSDGNLEVRVLVGYIATLLGEGCIE